MVLSLAIIGFIWQLFYSPDQGLINSILGDRPGDQIDWLGNPSLNLWAVLVAACWRHVGYIMVLYLAGLKGVDPSLREAAAIDGAERVADLPHRRLPGPAADQHRRRSSSRSSRRCARSTSSTSSTAARNGLELLSVLVYNNIVGEASRIGYGSAIAVILLVISIVPIIVFVWNSFRKEQA